MTRIAPSILACDFSRLAEELKAVKKGGADWIHVDVMDGHFVPNLTMGPAITAAANRVSDLPLDVHLMIENPDQYLEPFVDAGAHVVTVHEEVCDDLPGTLARIRELGAKCGVAVNPATPLERIEPVLAELDLLLVMSVNPGFGGQGYIDGSTEKLVRARALLDAAGSGAELEVDGGVGPGNAAEIVRAGATVLVAGSSVYRDPDGPAQGVRRLRSAMEG